jgi:hypothetical protein
MTVTGRVMKGRLVVNEPTELPGKPSPGGMSANMATPSPPREPA